MSDETSGTELYRRIVAFDHGSDEVNDLTRRVWEQTPYVVDAFTGKISGELYRKTMFWLRDAFGPECWPIHGRPGSWQSGSATVDGWTWLGFETEEKMNAYLAAFPSPPEPRS